MFGVLLVVARLVRHHNPRRAAEIRFTTDNTNTIGPTADRFRRAGLELPDPAPPAFVLGAVESSPLEVAAAYTLFSALGDRWEPRPAERVEQPSGRRLFRVRRRHRRVVGSATAYLVRDILQQAVREGPAGGSALPVEGLYGKTGTSSGHGESCPSLSLW